MGVIKYSEGITLAGIERFFHFKGICMVDILQEGLKMLYVGISSNEGKKKLVP